MSNELFIDSSVISQSHIKKILDRDGMSDLELLLVWVGDQKLRFGSEVGYAGMSAHGLGKLNGPQGERIVTSSARCAHLTAH